jgi:hypothetical protein
MITDSTAHEDWHLMQQSDCSARKLLKMEDDRRKTKHDVTHHLLKGENALPVALHVHDHPTFHKRLIERLVETAE